ncbi:YdeI/OmpD-associated family protein [Herbiconiux solani]|uniref:YdeI/OmpD-associated family protein n=1 Tax=Herbiconiux solani TaxID=661329 RepID=UPI0008242EBA|nr:YdeI/OmpD-associated family protein [Herbiconiux solani]
MKFTTTVLASGKTATGLPVPESVVTELDAGKRIPVVVTIGDYSYRSSIVFYGGQYLIALSAENREGAGVAAGDEIEVDVAVDDQPREVEVPADLAEALAGDSDAASAFAALSYSNKRRIVLSVEGAKTEATRQRRVEKALAELVS